MVAELKPAVCLRLLSSVDDCRACVELQRDVWGWDQADIVPATLLHVVDYVGGLVAGAFDPNSILLGFVFGITGIRDGEIVHWSHMLGVREAARNMGVGRMLKEYQRRVLAERGVARIYWTFDPLQAKNAYFNLNRLGAQVVEYVPDMYGVTGSPLHLGLATDRLVVCLSTAARNWTGVTPPLTPPGDHGVPILTSFARPSDRTVTTGEQRPPMALLEIPRDVLADIDRSPAVVRSWRMSVREYFMWALKHGYTVRGVHRNTTSGRSFYVLVRDPRSPSGGSDVRT